MTHFRLRGSEITSEGDLEPMLQIHKKRGRHRKPTLTLGIDCGPLSSVEGRESGVGTVTLNLVNELARLDERNTYTLYSFTSLEKEILDSFNGRVKNRVLPRLGYKSFWLRLALAWNKPHVFLATAQATPKTQVPVLGFIYDLAYLKYPKLYRNFSRLKKNTDNLMHLARHIVTISQSSQEAILENYHIDEEKISAFHPGISNIFTPNGPKYIDTYPYFLYVGALKKTKNIPQILKAFHKFIFQTSQKYKLVLVGNISDMDPEISQTIASLKLTDNVVVKSGVDTQDLPKYYRGALAFVSPALWEGFGLPLVEAMSSGTPVIAAKTSAMAEVVGKAGILVDPENTAEITRAFTQLATSASVRNKLIKKGLKRAGEFNWERFAKGVLSAVYKYCIE